eukprot:SAG31_NODE_4981_length_2820_cov_18.052554_1_plen_46_part_10
MTNGTRRDMSTGGIKRRRTYRLDPPSKVEAGVENGKFLCEYFHIIH